MKLISITVDKDGMLYGLEDNGSVIWTKESHEHFWLVENHIKSYTQYLAEIEAGIEPLEKE